MKYLPGSYYKCDVDKNFLINSLDLESPEALCASIILEF